ncbi:YhgE/Pip domain-containing protein [Paenibacillus harenae]|uniref:Membrane protein n=1 Tax=Paenibacillus harenae TaxID=306543 RepID=A0ABT9U4Z0_PAEHA|nr:YhgE/Pip domain-containing protein [Paenibacillus harenae]MDQ0114709.1 putative membrane protein [Paenibacillus harenae]
MKWSGLKQFGKELSGIGKNKMLLISIVGVMVIPVMYSAMFISAFWDPYGHLDKMPVAVVNADKGYTFNDETLHIGDDFTEQLKENEKFEWHFISKEDALKGMEAHDYYMAIEIPADFSEKTTSLNSERPVPAQITYLSNESFNFLASQIGSKAVDTMKAELNKEITSAYTRTVFEQMEQLADGIGKAAGGAMEIADGTSKAKDGAQLIQQNLSKLVSGSVALQEGVAKLVDGSSALGEGAAALHAGTAGLTDGLAQLAAARQQLADGGESLGAGASKLGAGASELAGGLAQLADASGTLADGGQDAKRAAGQIAGGLSDSAAGEAQLADGAAKLANDLAQLAQADPELSKDESFSALLTSSRELAAGLSKSAEGQKQLSAGADQLNDGLMKLTAGLDQLGEKAKAASKGAEELGAGGGQLVAGAEQFNGGMKQFGDKLSAAADGSKELAAGAAKLDGGIGTLANGLSTLQSNVGPFVDGSAKLEDGAKNMTTGLLKLENGTQELSGKLSEASDKTADLDLTDPMVDMFADPIQLDVEKVSEVDNYGTGLAPYFLSLGLYVGAMMLTIVYSVRDPMIRPVNGWSWFLSKALTVVAIGTIQALIADAALLYLLDLQVTNAALFIGYSVLTSITYMMIIQFLASSMNNPGRFIAIILLIFQLTSSAGTFPIELVPDWLQAISPWLPMTYSVAGFRDIISSGDYSSLWSDSLILAGIALLFALLSYGYFTFSHRKTKGEDGSETATATIA